MKKILIRSLIAYVVSWILIGIIITDPLTQEVFSLPAPIICGILTWLSSKFFSGEWHVNHSRLISSLIIILSSLLATAGYGIFFLYKTM